MQTALRSSYWFGVLYPDEVHAFKSVGDAQLTVDERSVNVLADAWELTRNAMLSSAQAA